MFLNESEVDEAQFAACEDHHRPNLQMAVLTLARLMEWTNANSDGWHSWPKPSRASQKLQTIVHKYYLGRWDSHLAGDITAAELKAAYTPIKSLLTRQAKPGQAVTPQMQVFPNA